MHNSNSHKRGKGMNELQNEIPTYPTECPALALNAQKRNKMSVNEVFCLKYIINVMSVCIDHLPGMARALTQSKQVTASPSMMQ